MKRYQTQEWKYVSLHPNPPEAGFVNLYNKDGEFYLMNSAGQRWRLLKDAPNCKIVDDVVYTTDLADEILLVDTRIHAVTIIISDEFMVAGKSLRIKDMYFTSHTNIITIEQVGGGTIDGLGSYVINHGGMARMFCTDTLNYFVF